jgi:cation diffusion facilitator family transporter
MSIRIQRYIAILAVLLFLIKIYAWYLTHSVTILTDALESTVNVIAGFIGLYSVILAAKPRDSNHPYGHGKVQFVTSAIEGLLIIIAGLLIIYEAIMQLMVTKPLQKLDIGIWLILVTGLVNFFVGRYAISQGKKQRSVVVESAGQHLMSDAYSTAGIVIGIGMLLITKWLWLDSAIALVFAVIISVTGYRVLRRSMAGIMDEADETLLKEVIDFLQNNRKDQWVDLHNLRVIQYGEVLHIDTHISLPWYYSVAQAEKEIHDLEELVKTHFGNKVEFFIHIDGCLPFQCNLCALQGCPERKEAFIQQVQWNLQNVQRNEKHKKQ